MKRYEWMGREMLYRWREKSMEMYFQEFLREKCCYYYNVL
jgi:hypothetical protein